MNRWKMRGLAALAVASLAVAGCQNQGADESLEILPSIDTDLPGESMDTESTDMTSPSAEPSDGS